MSRNYPLPLCRALYRDPNVYGNPWHRQPPNERDREKARLETDEQVKLAEEERLAKLAI